MADNLEEKSSGWLKLASAAYYCGASMAVQFVNKVSRLASPVRRFNISAKSYSSSITRRQGLQRVKPGNISAVKYTVSEADNPSARLIVACPIHDECHWELWSAGALGDRQVKTALTCRASGGDRCSVIIPGSFAFLL